jgi:hypothetical protein
MLTPFQGKGKDGGVPEAVEAIALPDGVMAGIEAAADKFDIIG